MGELICRNLRAAKGAFILEVDFLRLAKGDKVAVLGENGCGKTTFLQTLGGLLPVTGEIFHDGARWDRMPPRERAAHLCYLPQESEVLFNLTVRELVDLVLSRDVLLRGEERRNVLDAMEMTEFEDRAYPSLSGGEKRRAMLARIFCRQSEVVLLDEPTASLDMRHSAMAMRHAVSVPATVVAAVHDLNLAVRYFDRFLLMKNGRILFDKQRDALDCGELEEIYGVRLTRHNDYFVPGR